MEKYEEDNQCGKFSYSYSHGFLNVDFESLIRALSIIWLDQANKSIKQKLD